MAIHGVVAIAMMALAIPAADPTTENAVPSTYSAAPAARTPPATSATVWIRSVLLLTHWTMLSTIGTSQVTNCSRRGSTALPIAMPTRWRSPVRSETAN